MKRLSLPLVLAAAAVAAVAAFAGVGGPDPARSDTVAVPDTVTTVGHGVVAVVPDRASISAGVHTQAATAADALARNARLMNGVVAALRQAGGDDLQTQQVSLYPRSDDQGAVTGYTADNTVSAAVSIAGAGALVDAAVAAGANTVGGPSLTISDQDARYREALKKAVADARAKAQALAGAGGFGVGPVSVVAEQSSAPQPVFERAAVPKAGSTPVEPGTQDVTADVTVTFRIR